MKTFSPAPKRAAALLACALASSTAIPAIAAEPASPALPTLTDKPQQSVSPGYQLPAVVVTAPVTAAPLVVETDPKNPRQPLPPNDGAGYLKSIPGFSMIRKGGVDGDPIFRGQSGSRLNILIDGTPMLGGCGMRMDPPTAYIFPEAFDKITILKGPQSVIAGGGVSGATVLVDRNAEPFAEPGVRGDISALGGSNGRNDQISDVAAGIKEGYVRAIATRSHADDYKDGSGNKVHSNYNRTSGTFIAGWTPDADTLLEGSAEISRARAAYADRMMDGAKFDRSSYRLRFERRNISESVSKVQALVYHDYIDHVMDRFTLRRWTGGMMDALSNPDRKDTGGKLLGEFKPVEGLTLTVGADVNRDEHSSRGLTAAEYLRGVDYKSKTRVPDMAFTTIGVFAEGRYELDGQRRIIAGYRVNRVETDKKGIANAPSDTDALQNGFARWEQDFAVGGLALTGYAGLGHAERAPDYWERNKLFTLNPEKTTQIDAGLIHKSKGWQASVSLFANRIQDYILLSSMSGKNIDAATWGGEAELAYAIDKNWTVETSLAYVRGENTSENKPLPQMPPLEVKFGVRYDDGTFLGGVLARAVSAQNRVDVGWGNIVGTDIDKTAGFGTLSANVGWRPKEGVTLTAGVDNLFDKTYAEAVSRASTASLITDGYTQTIRVNEPGRTFWVKGSVRF